MIGIWLPAFAAALLPIMLGALGALRPARDAVWVVVYGQALLYLFVGPAAVYPGLPSGAQDWYRVLSWQALFLFAVPACVLYALWAHRRVADVTTGPTAAAGPTWQIGRTANAVITGGSVASAVAFCWAAASSGLFYRRIGTEALAEASADLPLITFALYRVFVEIAPFLLALQIVVLRRDLARPGWERRAWVAAIGVTGLTFGAYVLVNSRQQFALLVAMSVCLGVLTRPRNAPFRPERALLGLAVIGFTAYGLRVIENVRDAVGEGRPMTDPRNLLWQHTAVLRDEESVFQRLNGVDLIARAGDGITAQGPALGALWAVPVVLSLDPIVRTNETETLKRSGLTTAKSFMLLRFAGIAETDYYSCIATDAYGNFGAAGFALVAVALAGLSAYVAGALTRLDSPAALVAGCFILSRVLPFEQEFATLLFGWVKLLPGVLAVAAILQVSRIHVADRGLAPR